MLDEQKLSLIEVINTEDSIRMYLNIKENFRVATRLLQQKRIPDNGVREDNISEKEV